MLQAVGAALFAGLCILLLRTRRSGPMAYWAAGWASLLVSLSSLWVAFYLGTARSLGQTLYLLGEYVFGYLVIAGCRRYARGRGPDRREAWLLVPAVALAVWLPRTGGGDFNVFFTIHTLLYAYLFFAAFRVLRRANPVRRSQAGIRVMKAALVLLVIDYVHYAPLFAASSLQWIPQTVPYLEYAPFYDLIVLVLLMFGMVMIETGDVQHELEAANLELAQARDRLEAMAHSDHLTSALTRHAFYSMIEDPRHRGRRILSGCAAVADIDNLKAINDRYGHAAGDAAIRAVAAAIRSCIRADDLLFRWGGDEFIVLLIGVTQAEARARLESLNARLRQTSIAGLHEPLDLTTSLGYAPFDSAASLDEVIALADTAMYDRKKAAG